MKGEMKRVHSPANYTKKPDIDDLIDDFIDAGVSPDKAVEYSLRYLAGGRYDVKNSDLAKEYPEEDRKLREMAKQIVDKLAKKNNHTFKVGGEEKPQEIITPDIDNYINENNRIMKIGCDWKGIKEIVNYEDEKIFIPTSDYCMIQCYEKFLNRRFKRVKKYKYGTTPRAMKLFLVKELVNCSCEKRHEKNCKEHESCNCQQAHTPECKKIIDETLSNLPQVVKYCQIKDKPGFRLLSRYLYKNKEQAIILVPLSNNCYHAILCKVNYKLLTKEDIKIKLAIKT
jgi:hypothetical protein